MTDKNRSVAKNPITCLQYSETLSLGFFINMSIRKITRTKINFKDVLIATGNRILIFTAIFFPRKIGAGFDKKSSQSR